jgi:hypothetical protein
MENEQLTPSAADRAVDVVEQLKAQLTPERLQEPLVQVAVAEPENPEALFVTEVFWL